MGERSEQFQDAAWRVASRIGVKDHITETSGEIDYAGARVPLVHTFNHGRWVRTITPVTFPEIMAQVEADELTFDDNPGLPVATEGRCINISDGDYKSVYIDKDGTADRVIKRYGWRAYESAEQAERAASKIKGIYRTTEEVTGITVLPNEVFAGQDPRTGAHYVYEIQQRGLFVQPAGVIPPQALPAIGRRIDRAFELEHGKLEKLLIERGFVTEGYFGVIDHLTMYITYDLISGQLVVKDIADVVHA